MSADSENLSSLAEEPGAPIESEPVPIPESWAFRAKETPSETEAIYVAVGVAKSTKALSGFSSSYDSISEPPRDVPALAVMYLRRDGRRAFVRTYRAVGGRGGEIPNPERFRSQLAKDPKYGDPVSDQSRGRWAPVLRERYGIELEDAEGGVSP